MEYTLGPKWSQLYGAFMVSLLYLHMAVFMYFYYMQMNMLITDYQTTQGGYSCYLILSVVSFSFFAFMFFWSHMMTLRTEPGSVPIEM